jgi:hypothetical protein
VVTQLEGEDEAVEDVAQPGEGGDGEDDEAEGAAEGAGAVEVGDEAALEDEHDRAPHGDVQQRDPGVELAKGADGGDPAQQQADGDAAVSRPPT